MNILVLTAMFLAGYVIEADSFSSTFRIFTHVSRHISSTEVSNLFVPANMITMLSATPGNSRGESPDEPYLQHVCPSCSYVYDESKGFKKRHPPGDVN